MRRHRFEQDEQAALTSRNFNHRLLSEMICHKDFQRMMLDAEIYVDCIADMRITNMNAAMEAVRQSVITALISSRWSER